MNKKRVSFFIAGIMQGSHISAQMHEQDYRSVIDKHLKACFPDAEIYDPLANHQESLDYNDDQGSDVFMNHNRMCGEVDVVIAYVPQASMGTAIEMWEAYRNKRIVITISPLAHNWAIKFLSNVVYADLDEFVAAVKNGEVEQIVKGTKT